MTRSETNDRGVLRSNVNDVEHASREPSIGENLGDEHMRLTRSGC